MLRQRRCRSITLAGWAVLGCDVWAANGRSGGLEASGNYITKPLFAGRMANDSPTQRVRKTGEKGDLQISVLVNRTLVTAEISAFRNASKRICLRGGGQRLSSRGTSSKPVVLSLTPTGTRSAGVVGSARRKGGSGNRGRPVMCEGSGLKAAVVRALRPGNAGGGKDPDF
jgi:hypothetical protein